MGLTYEIVGGPAGHRPVYFAFGNYTTLGYGDVIPVEGWRILGPMTALKHLLIGWSTAPIFQVLRRTNPEWGKSMILEKWKPVSEKIMPA